MARPSRKHEKRAEILKAAASIFRRKGFGGTSMRELGASVSLDAASVYNYIRSKDEILEAICFSVAERYLEQLDPVAAMTGHHTHRLEALIEAHIRATISDTDAVAVANTEWRCLTGQARAQYKNMRQHYEDFLARLINQGVEAGEFKQVDPTVARYTILSALRWVESWYRDDRDVSVDALVASITALLIDGLRRDPSS